MYRKDPELHFKTPSRRSQLWGEALALLSADLSVTTGTAGGEEPEEHFLPCSFGSLMLCNTDLDSALLLLREVPGHWNCSEKRGLLPRVGCFDALLWIHRICPLFKLIFTHPIVSIGFYLPVVFKLLVKKFTRHPSRHIYNKQGHGPQSLVKKQPFIICQSIHAQNAQSINFFLGYSL